MIKSASHRLRRLTAAVLLIAFVGAAFTTFPLTCKAAQEQDSSAACLASVDSSSDGYCSMAVQKKAPVDYTPAPSLEAISLILQNPELPNGCEVTSLAMLLSSTGVLADKLELHSNYLHRENIIEQEGTRLGPDPSEAYVGDASDHSGWYCFEGPVLAAGDDWLEEHDLPWQMNTVTGLEQKELKQYLEQGIALIAWVTLDYEAPRISDYTWHLSDGTVYAPYSNLHCVVLTGLDGENYRVADPIAGWQTVLPQTFWDAFHTMGRRAVTLTPNN